MTTLLQTIAAIATATLITIAITTIGTLLYITHNIYTYNIRNTK